MITTSTRVEDAKLRAMLAACEAATPVEPRDLMAYEHGGGRLAIIRDGKRDLIADFYGDGPDRDHYANCDPDTIRSILSELLDLREAVKPFAALAVRPLKWEPSGRYPFVAMSDYYDIGHQSGDGRYWVHHRIFGDLREGDGTIEHHLTLDAAKAAAQEDHERKILWQIVGSSDPDVAPPNVEHLRPLADREKSAALVYHEEPAGDTQGAGWVNQVQPKQKCPACQGTGDIGGNPSYGPCPDCGGSGKVSAALVSPPDNGGAIAALLDAYDAETKNLPLGHEMPTRGASTYNADQTERRQVQGLEMAAHRGQLTPAPSIGDDT